MSFDAVARPYRVMESLVFGATLQRARVAWLGEARGARRALIVGEGDGRFLRALLQALPDVTVDCVDGSARMLALARERVDASPRVRFVQADLTTFAPDGRYDLVVTHFVLDCFGPTELAPLVARLAACLESGGCWLLADFAVPAGALRGARARLWLAVMYRFFAATTGLRVRHLTDPAPMLRAQGFARSHRLGLDADFVTSSVWRRA